MTIRSKTTIDEANGLLIIHHNNQGYCNQCPTRFPCETRLFAIDYIELVAKAERLERSLQTYIESPPAQMSFDGRMIPINADGMRLLINECQLARRAQSDAEWTAKGAENARDAWRKAHDELQTRTAYKQNLTAEIVRLQKQTEFDKLRIADLMATIERQARTIHEERNRSASRVLKGCCPCDPAHRGQPVCACGCHPNY